MSVRANLNTVKELLQDLIHDHGVEAEVYGEAEAFMRTADIKTRPEDVVKSYHAIQNLIKELQPRPLSDEAKTGENILVYGLPTTVESNELKTVEYRHPGWHTAHWDSIDQAFCLSGGSWLGPFILEPLAWMPLPKFYEWARVEGDGDRNG